MECLTEGEKNSILMIVCVISICFGIVVILLSLLPKIFEPLTRYILINLSINSILNNSSFLIGLSATGNFCISVSYIKSCLLIPGVLFSSLIPQTLHSVFVKNKSLSYRPFKFCLILSYIIIPLMSLLPFSTNSYDNEEYKCSGLKKYTEGIIWRFLLIYTPSVSIIIRVLVYYAQLYKKLRNYEEFSYWSFFIDRGLIYSLAYLIIFIQLTVARIIQLASDSCAADWFLFSGICCIFMIGTFNAIVTLSRKDVIYSILFILKIKSRRYSNSEYVRVIINE